MLEGHAPLGVAMDATGIEREIWQVREGDDGATGIVFELPEWTVVVPTASFDDADVAAAFTVTQDARPFPVISAEAPFELSRETGEGGSAHLTLSDGWLDVILEPGPCDPEYLEVDTGWVLTCGADGQVNISVYSSSTYGPVSYAKEIDPGAAHRGLRACAVTLVT